MSTLTATVTADGKTLTDSRNIQVRPFSFPQRRNLILFIGDAMGTAYRDSIRLVDRAIVNSNGKSSFREGFFDSLSEMDRMPVSGMSMTYGTDAIVPDSANTRRGMGDRQQDLYRRIERIRRWQRLQLALYWCE